MNYVTLQLTWLSDKELYAFTCGGNLMVQLHTSEREFPLYFSTPIDAEKAAKACGMTMTENGSAVLCD